MRRVSESVASAKTARDANSCTSDYELRIPDCVILHVEELKRG